MSTAQKTTSALSKTRAAGPHEHNVIACKAKRLFVRQSRDAY